NIELHHLADFTYYYSNLYLEVWVGRVKQNLEVAGDENELYWSELNCNFFDMEQYAGNGNIGHILEEIKYYWKQLLKLE
ncbi:MAG: NUDIX hydrolase, partial [Firmicutes bacterium]|nr:NUDIX hydrolase [Bacillota bacterium]